MIENCDCSWASRSSCVGRRPRVPASAASARTLRSHASAALPSGKLRSITPVSSELATRRRRRHTRTTPSSTFTAKPVRACSSQLRAFTRGSPIVTSFPRGVAGARRGETRVRGAVRHCCVSRKACVLAIAGRETATSWGERRYASSEETDGFRSVAFRRKAERRVGLRRVRAFVSLPTMSSSTDPPEIRIRVTFRR
jgi:hypothetical protein